MVFSSFILPKICKLCPFLYTFQIIKSILSYSIDDLLVDSVANNDENVVNQFRQIIDNQPAERKQMALGVLRVIFSYFDKEEGV